MHHLTVSMNALIFAMCFLLMAGAGIADEADQALELTGDASSEALAEIMEPVTLPSGSEVEDSELVLLNLELSEERARLERLVQEMMLGEPEPEFEPLEIEVERPEKEE